MFFKVKTSYTLLQTMLSKVILAYIVSKKGGEVS